MAIIKSATKRIRSSARKKVFNLRRKRTMRDQIKLLTQAIAKGDGKTAQSLMPLVQKAIDKAVQRGVIKKNTGARKKSRLVASLKKAS